MQVVVSKAADARKPFKKKKEDPADENEEEDLRQFMKDRAKKPPSKKFEDHDSPFSFLTPDNKIVQQPSSRKLVDASSNLADDSAPVEINVEDMRKDIDDILFERQRSLQATSARRPGSVRGKTAALHRKTPSSARSVDPIFLLAVERLTFDLKPWIFFSTSDWQYGQQYRIKTTEYTIYLR
jgi:hypothetical protein